MENAAHVRLVMITTAAYDSAQHLARILVSERLAACCNVVPAVYSVFGWNGSIQENQEALIMAKTTVDKLAALEARVLEIHTYDVPEIVSMPFDQASAPYLLWLKETLD